MISHSFKSPDEIPKDLSSSFDVIVVLGGGAPRTVDLPPSYVLTRCKAAAQVYHQASPSNKPKILTLSAGTAHVPQLLSSDGLPVWESTASASYLMKELNIPPTDVYAETTSYDTISNAFFTRTSFCDIIGWKRLLIITNDFHIMRTKYIFDWVMNVPDKKSADSSKKYQLYFLSTKDEGLSGEAVRVRNEREEKSANNVKNKLSKQYTTLSEVFDFMTQNHSFYTAEKLVERGNKVMDKNELKKMSMLRQSYGGNGSSNPSFLDIGVYGNNNAASFAWGALFGVVSVGALLILKLATSRGSKTHSK